jgi:hypothetical protein
VKHFLVIDVIVTVICASAYIKLLQLAPGFWPLYLIDILLRFYALFTIYSLLVYYNENLAKFNASTSSEEIDGEVDIEKVVIPVKPIRPVQGVLKIFDNFIGFVSLKACAFLFVVLNFLSSIGLLVYFLCFEKFNELQLVMYLVCFVVNAVMVVLFVAAIKMVSGMVLLWGSFAGLSKKLILIDEFGDFRIFEIKFEKLEF